MFLNQNFLSSFKEQAKTQFGFEQIEFIPLPSPTSFEFYQTWIDQGHHAEMTYLKEHLPLKTNFASSFKLAQTAMVVTHRYCPHPKPEAALQRKGIARYAQGQDYHFWLQEKLEAACKNLQEQFPELQYFVATDSKPILERDLARQAGLGWVGKNTCLIHPKFGSYFFIGEALLSLPLALPLALPLETTDSQKMVPEIPDFCGTCTACFDACPTGAIEAPRVLNANKCLAFWNIEAKSTPPEKIRPALGEWFFGCDVCQEVCPWNQKFFRQHPRSDQKNSHSRQEEIEFLRKILTRSNREILSLFANTPLLRARPTGLKRNALLVAAKLKASELLQEISNLESHPKLSELACWTKKRIAQLP